MIRRAIIAALALLTAGGCGPPAHVLDRVPAPVRPAWIASQPEAAQIAPERWAEVDRLHGDYTRAMELVRAQRLAPLARGVEGIDPKTCDPQALRRWIAEARTVRLELDASEDVLWSSLANAGVVAPVVAERWSTLRRFDRELDRFRQGGFGVPPDVMGALRAAPPAGWDAERVDQWRHAYRAWLGAQLASLNEALLVRPLDRRLAPPAAPVAEGAPAPDPIDDALKARVKTLFDACIADGMRQDPDPAWQHAFQERVSAARPSAPTPPTPKGARYPDDLGAAAIFLPPPPSAAEWAAFERAAGLTEAQCSPLQSEWETLWTQATGPIALRAKHEVELAQAMAEDPTRGTPREVAQRLHAAIEECTISIQDIGVDADDRLFTALGDRATPELAMWWRCMRLVPPRSSTDAGAGLGRAFGMGAGRRDRALVELAAISAVDPVHARAALSAMAASTDDRLALSHELVRARLRAWRAIFEALVTSTREPSSFNPTVLRAAVASSADMSARFVAMQESLLADCDRALPGTAPLIRAQVRSLAWPEFFAASGDDPIDQHALITARALLGAGFATDAASMDAALERELSQFDAAAGRRAWAPGTPLVDPESDWAAVLRREPTLFDAAWSRVVRTDRAVRNAALDPKHPNRASLVQWLERAARQDGP